jgi:hypothetical protein
MLRPVITLAAVGAVGFLVWNLLLGFLFPLVVGLVALVIKIVFWAAVIAFAIWVFKRLTRTSPSEA